MKQNSCKYSDHFHWVAHKGKPVKQLKGMRCCYLEKRLFVNCCAKSQNFSYVNFRGSRLKNVDFREAKLHGCDFWGVTFNKCKFQSAVITDCVFVACKFHKCFFEGCSVDYTVIVNTNLLECKNLVLCKRVENINYYPDYQSSQDMEDVLKHLKNRMFKKYRLLYLPRATAFTFYRQRGY